MALFGIAADGLSGSQSAATAQMRQTFRALPATFQRVSALRHG